jgi:hypothetical protein
VTASPSVVPDKGSATILAATAFGSAPLSYTWAATQAPGPVAFGTNDSIDASSTVVSFVAPGSYVFRVQVTDGCGLRSTSNVPVTVRGSPGALVVAPFQVQVEQGGTVAFRADAWDELGSRITVSPAWSVSGGGRITSGGLFTATTPGGPFAVGALSGSLSGQAMVTVVVGTNPAPVLDLASNDSGSGTIRFTGEGVPGRTYTVEFTVNLNPPDWRPLGTVLADALGKFGYLDHPPADQPSRFYRVSSP